MSEASDDATERVEPSDNAAEHVELDEEVAAGRLVYRRRVDSKVVDIGMLRQRNSRKALLQSMLRLHLSQIPLLPQALLQSMLRQNLSQLPLLPRMIERGRFTRWNAHQLCLKTRILCLVLDLANNHGCFQHLEDHVHARAGMEFQVWADYHKNATEQPHGHWRNCPASALLQSFQIGFLDILTDAGKCYRTCSTTAGTAEPPLSPLVSYADLRCYRAGPTTRRRASQHQG